MDQSAGLIRQKQTAARRPFSGAQRLWGSHVELQAEEFVKEIDLAVSNLPSDQSSQTIKNILPNINNGLNGQPIVPIRFPV